MKLLLLAATAALAIHARLRLIPDLTDDNLTGLAWHIRGIPASCRGSLRRPQAPSAWMGPERATCCRWGGSSP